MGRVCLGRRTNNHNNNLLCFTLDGPSTETQTGQEGTWSHGTDEQLLSSRSRNTGVSDRTGVLARSLTPGTVLFWLLLVSWVAGLTSCSGNPHVEESCSISLSHCLAGHITGLFPGENRGTSSRSTEPRFCWTLQLPGTQLKLASRPRPLAPSEALLVPGSGRKVRTGWGMLLSATSRTRVQTQCGQPSPGHPRQPASWLPHARLSTCSIQLFSGKNLGSGYQRRLEGWTRPFEGQTQRLGSQEPEDGIWDKHAMNTSMLG